MKLPSSLGTTIDAIAKIIEARRVLTEKDNELKEQELILRNHLTANFAKDKISLDGARGKLGIAILSHPTVPDIKDWDKFYAWIAKTKSWDCLQKRLGATAIALRWDAGKAIPGVEKKEIEVLKVSLIKKPAAKKAA